MPTSGRPVSLRITEIFHSLQGETSRAGLPTVFVRLTGCPLRCTWCDTEYAFTGGTTRPLDDILAEVARHGLRLGQDVLAGSIVQRSHASFGQHKITARQDHFRRTLGIGGHAAAGIVQGGHAFGF